MQFYREYFHNTSKNIQNLIYSGFILIKNFRFETRSQELETGNAKPIKSSNVMDKPIFRKRKPTAAIHDLTPFAYQNITHQHQNDVRDCHQLV